MVTIFLVNIKGINMIRGAGQKTELPYNEKGNDRYVFEYNGDVAFPENVAFL